MKPTVLITGVCGSLGKLLAKDLCARNYHVLGIDHRPFRNKPKNLELCSLDLRKNQTYSFLKHKKPQAIIHMGVIRNPLKQWGDGHAYYFNLEIANKLLKLAEEIEIQKFIFLSSANLYGPSARTCGFLSEESPLHGADRSPEIRDLVLLDVMIQSFFWKQPNIETVILRPVHMIGPHLHNAPSQYLRLPLIPTLLGYDPMIQMVDETDVLLSLFLSLQPGKKGIFNITGKDQAPLSRIISACKKPKLPIPEQGLRFILNQMFRFHFSTFPPGELDHLKYTCLVDGGLAKKILDYEPQIPLMHTLKSFTL